MHRAGDHCRGAGNGPGRADAQTRSGVSSVLKEGTVPFDRAISLGKLAVQTQTVQDCPLFKRAVVFQKAAMMSVIQISSPAQETLTPARRRTQSRDRPDPLSGQLARPGDAVRRVPSWRPGLRESHTNRLAGNRPAIERPGGCVFQFHSSVSDGVVLSDFRVLCPADDHPQGTEEFCLEPYRANRVPVRSLLPAPRGADDRGDRVRHVLPVPSLGINGRHRQGGEGESPS